MSDTIRCGSVAIVGAPNAGKSTLVNALVGQKVAIVSAKVQTTRTRLIGIATEGSAQLLLIDTPGIFAPRRRLDRPHHGAAQEQPHHPPDRRLHRPDGQKDRAAGSAGLSPRPPPYSVR